MMSDPMRFSNDSPRIQWPTRGLLIALTLAVPAGLLSLAGCTRRPPPGATGSESGGQSCTELLDSAYPLLQPGVLGVTADAGRAVQLLSQWITTDRCDFESMMQPIDEEDRELLSRLFTAEELDEVTRTQFGEPDIVHVRDRIFDQRMATGLTEGLDTDRERIAVLFDAVIQNVHLLAPGAVELPLDTFTTRLLGRGSAEDRAWIFAELLRQLQLDSVIIRPSGDSNDGPFWVGVVTLDGIRLYDTAAGVPVPAEEPRPTAELEPAELAETASVRPATLAEAIANPSLLNSYRPDGKEVSAGSLQPPVVQLITTTSHNKQVVDVLSQSIADEANVKLYDPLQDTNLGKGLVSRVAAAGGEVFDAEDIRVWDYPAKTLAASRDLSDQQRQRLQLRLSSFDAPIEIDPETKSEERKGRQREARIDMLFGNPVQALKEFQLIRIDERLATQANIRPDIRTMYQQATDDAFYWTALCQFDRGGSSYETAATTAERYVKTGGSWTAEAARLEAVALAAAGEFEQAIAKAEQCFVDGVGTPRLRLLLDRWKAAANDSDDIEAEEPASDDAGENSEGDSADE